MTSVGGASRSSPPPRLRDLCPSARSSRKHFAPVFLIVGLAIQASAGEKADRIFINGRIWTGDELHPRVEALAVRGTTILATGTTHEIRRFAEKGTETIDLKGRFAAPGFNDAHLHFMKGSLTLEEIDLTGAGGALEVQRRLAAYARAHSDRPWFLGRGWGGGEGGELHRRLLDAVVSDRPVWLQDREGRAGWANSVALAVGGIDGRARDPEPGSVGRDPSGEPTGRLRGAAADLVRRHIPPPGAEDKYRALRKGLDLAASYGLTSVQDVAFNDEDFPAVDRLVAEGGLKLRFYCVLPLLRNPTPDSLAHYHELQKEHQSPRFRFGGVGAEVDGPVEDRAAALIEPYVGGGTGRLQWTPEDLNQASAVYDRERFQILLSAWGDKAIRMALDAFAYAARVNGPRSRRHRVEYAEVPAPVDRARFKALGVVASTQALFVGPEGSPFHSFVALLGPERAAQARALRLWDEAGVVQAFGSDWPASSGTVLAGICAAATRPGPEGKPGESWPPENRISVEAALRHYTRDAAQACLEESIRGTLSAGKAADLVVLSDDILAIPPEQIPTARVLLTVMGGQDTYRAKEF